MKVYPKRFLGFDIKEEKLLPYLIEEEVYAILYSIEGIFKIKDDTIKKLKFIDVPIQSTSIGCDMLIDKSVIREYDTQYQIPYNHIKFDHLKQHYSLSKNKKSFVTLIVEKQKNTEFNEYSINDIYFDVSQEVNNPIIKEDLATFLSMLNYI